MVAVPPGHNFMPKESAMSEAEKNNVLSFSGESEKKSVAAGAQLG